MNLSVEQMKVILDMYAVVRIEGQENEEILALMCEIAFELDKLGFTVCSECFTLIDIPSLENRIVLPGGDIMELCDLCIKE